MSPANPSGTNTLALATSPYLRQHADNPVHWQQWTPQALAEAAARAVPILLSVGYAACHWCHVMAHESFDDDEVAAAMNAGFVCIKVDREERPDIDAVYMNATVALTGQGGWPMTCFLTPNGRPFFCGTYYPKAAFLQLLSAISETWRERRAEVEQASDHIAAELRSMASGLPGGGPEVAPELCDDAVAGVLREQDTAHGGFGGAPKFPPSALLEALMRHYERTRSPAALEAVARTGNAMARGGIYDQLGGGFARYSVDGAWVVPHFEKMLYDNALLLRAYAHWARRTGDPLARRVAAQTARFLLDELGSKAPADMFTSSLDADADGREGSTYVWTPVQLTEVLGGDDGRWAAEVFGVLTAGELARAVRGTVGRYSPFAVYLPRGDPGRLAPVRDGQALVQDEGSQLVARALTLAPVDGDTGRWLDLCAGPGGKTALLAGLGLQCAARVTAVEPSPHRADLVAQNTRGLPVELLRVDGRHTDLDPGFDRVLVDAPCTGLGALRRRPEARWRRQPADVAALAKLQRELLSAAIALTRPGGVVLYATCSPHLAETVGAVADALRRHPVHALDTRPLFEPVIAGLGEGPHVQLWPHRHGTDAMFAAALRRLT